MKNNPKNHSQWKGNQPPPRFDSQFKISWIKEKIDQESIDFAEEFGEYLAKSKFTTSQFRNVYGEIKRIQLKGYEENKTEFLLLKPKLAYASSRANTPGAKAFEAVISKAHNQVLTDSDGELKRFENFCDLVEAILAYHKAKGGRD